ncbi:DCC1-like thiol-disulfide oxidoreductase family protein [Olivibacter sp. CPCC 100613]|uniref:thiol-disulfide oxidoreductase DCC family protein n=1 Tax=Olivibacter sp. CPCC 100613 TaxID=3079931 RepID=UPI002FF9E7C9
MASFLTSDKDIILFDGICSFCNRYTRYVIAKDHTERFVYASLQGNSAKVLAQRFDMKFQNMNSMIVIHGEKFYEKSDAVIYIFSHLKTKWRYLAAVFKVFPKHIRDFLYDCFANRRYKLFGKSKNCEVPNVNIRKRFLP